MLDHLLHFPVANSADAIEILEQGHEGWLVFMFPLEKTEKGTKNAMYRRMWKFRTLGYDAMVRQENGRFILVARSWIDTPARHNIGN